MNAQKLGFGTSWKMLTRDKGWVKPLLVLALVGWIPIFGQIVVLGYALEWARLTAWGVDAAPKQSGVQYGKLFRTGGIAFLVSLTLGIVLALVSSLLFGGMLLETAFAMSAVPKMNVLATLFGGASLASLLVYAVVNLLTGTFINIAMMRATIYDGFAAGWRLDRIFQMISRDFGGFLRVYLVSFVAGLVSWLYSSLVTFVEGLFMLSGAVGMAAAFSWSGTTEEALRMFVDMMTQIGPGPLLTFLLVGIAVEFFGAVLAVAMQLVSINAAGQWFNRFDVARWGTSAAPLPEDAPTTKGFSS